MHLELRFARLGCNREWHLSRRRTEPSHGVHRAVPTASCFLRGSVEGQNRLVSNRIIEFWLIQMIGGDFNYTIGNPSRYHDLSLSGQSGRIVDLRY